MQDIRNSAYNVAVPNFGGVPRNTHWSWRQLVRDHGEEDAFALLQLQPGLGQFMGYVMTDSTGSQDASVSAGYEEVHDELPPCAALCPASPMDLDLGRLLPAHEAGVYWRADGRLVSSLPIDVGERLNPPWTGDAGGEADEEFMIHVRRAHAARYGP